MENSGVCFAVAIVVLVVPLGIVAIWAAQRVSRLTRQMEAMQRELGSLGARLRRGDGAEQGAGKTATTEEEQTLAPIQPGLQSVAPGADGYGLAPEAEAPVVVPVVHPPEEKTITPDLDAVAAEIKTTTEEEQTLAPIQPGLQSVAPGIVAPEVPRISEALGQKKSGGGLELFLGRQILAWAGMLVLLVAAVLFLKYAFEHHMLSPMGKVLILSGLGVAVLGLGEWFNHKKWLPLARTMSGGGIGLLLFAAFAAMALFDLIGWQACLGWMALVVGLSILLAVRYDSLTIAIISTLAGVAVPLMLWTRQLDFNLVFLFLAGVDAGVMVLAMWRRWRVVNLIALAGTVLVVLLWLGDKHHFQLAHEQIMTYFQSSVKIPHSTMWIGVEPWMAAKVIGGFFLLFLAVSVVYHAWRREEAALDLPLLVGNPVWAYATAYGLFHHDYHNWMAPVALVGFGVYVLVAVVLWRRVKEPRSVVVASAAVAIGLLTTAIPINYEGLKIPLVLAAEAGVLYGIAAAFRKSGYRVAGFVVYLLTAIALLWFWHDLTGAYVFFWNERCLTVAVVIASLAATAVWVRCGGELPWPACSSSCAAVPALFAHLAVLFLFTVEARMWLAEKEHFGCGTGYCFGHDLLVYSIGYLVYAVGLLAAGFWWRQLYLRVAATVLVFVGIGCLLNALFGLSNYETQKFALILNRRCLGFAVAIVWFVLANRLIRRGRAGDAFFGDPAAAVVAALAGHGLFLALFTLETITYFSHAADRSVGLRTEQMVIAIGYLIYAVGLLAAGFGLRQLYLRVAATVLAVVGFFVLLPVALDCGPETLWQPMGLNLRFLAFGVAIAWCVVANRLSRRRSAGAGWPDAASAPAVFSLAGHALVLGLFTLETITYFSRAADGEAGLRTQKMVLTIGYLVYAIGLLAAGFGWRQLYLRVAATVLAGLAAAKLLTFDGNVTYAVQAHAVMNLRCLAFVCAIAWLVLANRMIRRRSAEDQFFGDPAAAAAFALAGHLLVLVLFTLETATFFGRYEDVVAGHLGRQMVYSIFYAVYAAGLLAAGFVWRRMYLRVAALVLFAVTLGKVFLYDLRELEALYRIASFAGLAILLLVGAWLYNKYQGRVVAER